jgi:hypothetical protein
MSSQESPTLHARWSLLGASEKSGGHGAKPEAGFLALPRALVQFALAIVSSSRAGNLVSRYCSMAFCNQCWRASLCPPFLADLCRIDRTGRLSAFYARGRAGAYWLDNRAWMRIGRPAGRAEARPSRGRACSFRGAARRRAPTRDCPAGRDRRRRRPADHGSSARRRRSAGLFGAGATSELTPERRVQ